MTEDEMLECIPGRMQEESAIRVGCKTKYNPWRDEDAPAYEEVEKYA